MKIMGLKFQQYHTVYEEFKFLDGEEEEMGPKI